MSNTSPAVLLAHHLKQLRLPAMRQQYGSQAELCAKQKVDYPDYLLRLTELELADRQKRAMERRIKQARFPMLKTLDGFDFSAQPSLNESLIRQLAAGEFMERRENVLLMGNSGTGKTHLAIALGFAACGQGKNVRFFGATDLVTQLREAGEERKLRRQLHQLQRQDLLILDELGYVPFSKAGAELLFEVVSRAYERQSLVITTNLPFEQWPEVCGSERMTGAMLDRLTHRVHIIEANGKSYRLRESKQRLKNKKMS
jgi:DNA replication protein DnaC